jgi:hypothetical protein
MAIKIRCQDCKKKISIDEAFAGGMCRCPYCKALVYVEDAAGGRGKSSGGARPTAPTHRPAAPGPAAPAQAQAHPHAAAEAGTPADVEHVPMARPVKIQGIITIVLLVLLVFMIGGAVAMALFYLHGDRDGVPPPPTTQPVIIDVKSKDGAGVVDIKITAPVIYVMDGGSGMRSVFDSARIAVLNSVESLGDGKFNVIVAGEGGDTVISPGLTAGGKSAAGKLTPTLQEVIPTGAADISRAITAAIAMKPKTIVLLTRKAVDDPAGLAGRAKAQGTVIHTIVIDGDSEAIESMKKLAGDTGGQTRTFSSGGL